MRVSHTPKDTQIKPSHENPLPAIYDLATPMHGHGTTTGSGKSMSFEPKPLQVTK